MCLNIIYEAYIIFTPSSTQAACVIVVGAVNTYCIELLMACSTLLPRKEEEILENKHFYDLPARRKLLDSVMKEF